MLWKNLSQILNRDQKIKTFLILIMMIIGGLLETVAVSMVIPLVSIIIEPDSIQSNSLLNSIYNLFHLETKNQFLVFIILAMIFVYIFKNVFLFILYYVQANFTTKGQYLMAKEILSHYMNKPYEYYLNASTSDIIRIIQGDVSNTFALLTNVLQFLTELVVFLCLIFLLMYLDPTLMIGIAIVLGLTMLVSKKLCQSSLSKAGKDMQEYSSIAYKWLIQGIEGIKDIKILQKENYFVQNYEKSAKKTSIAQKKNSVLSQTPRLIIETVGMCGMLAMIAILLCNGRSIEGMATQITAFAMAAVRLMPSANRMNSYLNVISYLNPSLETVVKEIECSRKEQVEQENNKHMVENKKLSFTQQVDVSEIQYAYPNCEKNLFEDANMVIPIGKSVAVIGSSGAGKTTIIDILLGLLKPKSGSINVDGVNVEMGYASWLDKIGYIPQSIFMLDGTIRENIAFGVKEEEIDDNRVWKVLEDAQLKEHIVSLPEGLDTEIGEKGVRLSGGQRQRLGIARALYHDPDILVFDEATSALDNDTEAAIMDSINKFQGEKTLIIIAHRLATIKNCDIIYRVVDGKIIREENAISK